MKEDLLSIIVPIYNTEKYIKRCLTSICKSSYKNLEIICVDDGSTDNSMQIVSKMKSDDDRITIVKHTENRGLFRARVSGLKAAQGAYIAFVDADDFVGIDWFRLLHKKAVEESSDIVIGNTVNVDEKENYSYYNNYRSINQSHKRLSGSDVLNMFMVQEGACYFWHTVWNKIYSRKLIEKCMPYLEQIEFHLIMCEDILFSSVFYTHADSLSFTDSDAYFYFRHSEASTGSSLPFDKMLKYIADVGNVFSYFQKFMIEYDSSLFEQQQNHYYGFLERYHRIWTSNVYLHKKQHSARALDAMREAFDIKELRKPKKGDFYFTELYTPWADRFEGVKKMIAKDKYKVVSFDIFDTLIVRPFMSPKDLLILVGKYANTLIPQMSEHSFVNFRMMAEEQARGKLVLNRSMWEDVTLSEIYREFAELMHVDTDCANKIMNEEIRLEIKFSSPRKIAKELYEYAQYIGKRIVITSDMYLEKNVVEEILEKNGYVGYEQLFLSSDLRRLKATGSLFDVMIKSTKVKPREIVHIGDNWTSDIVVSEKQGCEKVFMAKTVETMENCLKDIYTGRDLSFYKNPEKEIVDYSHFEKEIVTRSMAAVFANKLFDNPYQSMKSESNYNGNAYETGYATMGPHFWGLANWIKKISLQNGYKKIVFLARDGLLLKNIFDYICQKTGIEITTEYFYASRKSLMPYSIKSVDDLYLTYEYFNLAERKHTTQKIFNLLSPILKPFDEATLRKYANDGILMDKAVLNKKEFFEVIDAISKYSFDQALCDAKRKEMQSRFAKVFDERTATFDVGYSGRLQKTICELAGRPIDAFYVHSNGYETDTLSQSKFNVHCFYDFTPTISNVVREFFISAPEASCLGYKIESDNLVPIFEQKNFAYEGTFAILEYQKGAYEFCQDFTDYFAEFIDNLPYRNTMVSLPFEHYLLSASKFDRWVFRNSNEEDDIFTGYQSNGIVELWEWYLNRFDEETEEDEEENNENEALYDIAKLSKFKRALFFLLFDRKTFRKKLKKNLHKDKDPYKTKDDDE